jgi:lipopolysaccharide cholinephosphotransferase
MRNIYLEKRLENSLRSCQIIQAELLQQFDQICRKHQLKYWLDGGTLLGAVRHGGFIPWDDDIDVAMPKKDFRTFLEIAQEELAPGVFLQTKNTDVSYSQNFAKLVNLNSFYLSEGDDLSLPYKKCIYIDVFEFTEYPTIPLTIIKNVARQICIARYFFSVKHRLSIKSILHFLFVKAKYHMLNIIWSVCCLMPKGKYISNVITDNGYGIVHRLDSIYPLGKICFEGNIYSCPSNTDVYLKNLYNNYMELPPIEKRISHAIYIEPKLLNNINHE